MTQATENKRHTQGENNRKQEISEEVRCYINAATKGEGDEADEFREAFEKWLEAQPRIGNKVLYRGYCFEKGYFEDCNFTGLRFVTEDQITQSTHLPAFTTDMIRASMYQCEFGSGNDFDDGVKVLFEVHTNGKYFVDISKESAYPEEHECRCVRGTKLKIIRYLHKPSYYHIICTEE